MTSEVDIPRCYACGGAERPFKLKKAGEQWRHVAELPGSGGEPAHCDAIVCPVCGAAPQPGLWCCAACKAFGEQLRQQQRQQRTGRGRQKKGNHARR